MNELPQRVVRAIAVGSRLLGVGALLTLVGGVTLALSQTAEIAFAADRAEVPHSLEFEATGGDYRLVLLADPLGIRIPSVGNPVAYILCTVNLSDGSSVTVDGSSSGSRTETDLGVEIGRFSAPAGPTTATCTWNQDRDTNNYFYSVGPTASILSTVALVVLVVGIAMLGIAIPLLVLGYRARAQVLPPPGPDGTLR